MTELKVLCAEEVDVMDSVTWIGCHGKWKLDFKRKGHGARKMYVQGKCKLDIMRIESLIFSEV